MPFAAIAQQTGRTYRLGCLFATPREANIAFSTNCDGTASLFIEAQNLAVAYRAFVQHVNTVPWRSHFVKAVGLWESASPANRARVGGRGRRGEVPSDGVDR